MENHKFSKNILFKVTDEGTYNQLVQEKDEQGFKTMSDFALHHFETGRGEPLGLSKAPTNSGRPTAPNAEQKWMLTVLEEMITLFSRDLSGIREFLRKAKVPPEFRQEYSKRLALLEKQSQDIMARGICHESKK